jgi:glutathione S-transferase
MKLYGYRNGRTLRALWALEEAQLDYEYVSVDLFKGEGQTAAFLKLNPAGKVPVLVDGEQTIPESAAICLHIAEKHPASGLLPPAATPERTDCYRWISFILTELDAPLWTIAKHRFALPAERRVEAVIETAAWEFAAAAKILATGLSNRDYLAAGNFTVVDILAAHTLLWARSARLSIGETTLLSYLRRLEERDALKRAQARPHASAPVSHVTAT